MRKLKGQLIKMNYKNEHRYPIDRSPYDNCHRNTGTHADMTRYSAAKYTKQGTACEKIDNTPKLDKGCGCAEGTELYSHGRSTTYPVCTTIPVVTGCVDEEYRIAMAYVPMQEWKELYDTASGFSHGTIFRELDLPWYPTCCRKETRL